MTVGGSETQTRLLLKPPFSETFCEALQFSAKKLFSYIMAWTVLGRPEIPLSHRCSKAFRWFHGLMASFVWTPSDTGLESVVRSVSVIRVYSLWTRAFLTNYSLSVTFRRKSSKKNQKKVGFLEILSWLLFWCVAWTFACTPHFLALYWVCGSHACKYTGILSIIRDTVVIHACRYLIYHHIHAIFRHIRLT
jgi:hypothetical protein